MVSESAIVLGKDEARLEQHLCRLATLLGVQCRMISINGVDNFGTLASQGGSPACLMVSARVLGTLFREDSMTAEVVTRLLERVPFVFVFGITPGPEETYAVRHLTNGLISSVVSFDRCDYRYQVSASERDIMNEFSGLSFDSVDSEVDFGLVLSQPQVGFSTLVAINGLPIFACLKTRESRIFFLACRDIVDIQAHTDGSLTARQYFSRLVPALVFLRYVFQERTWHNPHPCANWIIDDPLLRKSYGFL